MKIETVEDFRIALDAGAYMWPGGYPVFFIASDGMALSFKAAEENRAEIEDALERHDPSGGWLMTGATANMEDDNLYCAHTDEKIECAYPQTV